jgi:hypothetical protein
VQVPIAAVGDVAIHRKATRPLPHVHGVEPCQRIAAQIRQRSRGEPIADRLVSVSDPDARPIRKGKLGLLNEFGYVTQLAEVTANTRRGARGYLLPAAMRPATQAGTACWSRPPPSWTASAFDRARSRWTAALCPG